jgi:spore coat protein H
VDGILGPGQNYYLYLHPESNKFSFIPWDQDQVFCQFPRGSQEQRENLSIHRPWTGENRFLERVFKCDSFKRLYIEKMTEFNKTIFQPKRIQQQVDDLAVAIHSSVEEESAERLSEFDKAVNGQSFSISMGFGFNGKFSIVPIKPFVQARHIAVDKQLVGIQ